LIQAIVDRSDLSPSAREHLSTCPQCGAGMKQIEQDLTNLAKVAERLAPASQRKIFLPDWRPSLINRWLLYWRLSFGAVAAAVVVILMIWLSVPKTVAIEDTFDIIDEISWEDDDFMTEVCALSENVLPQVYLDITEEVHSCLDDEFMKFVVPSVEENSLSYDQGRKGVKLCLTKFLAHCFC